MHDAYVSHGTQAQFVDYGRYKDDAHRLIVDRDGVPVWWPAVHAFLAELNLPTSVRYAVANPHEPKATGYASIDSVDAVPFLDEAGREGYRHFLNQHPSRAFAVSSEGAWSWAEGGDDPMALALDNCSKQRRRMPPVRGERSRRGTATRRKPPIAATLKPPPTRAHWLRADAPGATPRRARPASFPPRFAAWLSCPLPRPLCRAAAARRAAPHHARFSFNPDSSGSLAPLSHDFSVGWAHSNVVICGHFEHLARTVPSAPICAELPSHKALRRL
jgi:hypothetical protein